MELRDILTMIAIALGPVSAIIISLCIINPLQEKRKRKKDLFFTLLATRKKTSPTMPEKYLDALNIIDVVFYGEKKIIDAKKELLKSHNANPLQWDDYNRRLLDLLTVMGKTLGYKEINPSDFDTPFMTPILDSKISQTLT